MGTNVKEPLAERSFPLALAYFIAKFAISNSAKTSVGFGGRERSKNSSRSGKKRPIKGKGGS